jgi:hypothetical protein
MSQYENKILQSAISFMNQRNIVISVLMYDGLMIEGNFYEDENLINELTTFVNTQFLNLNMQWKYKPHSTAVKIPDNIEVEYIKPQDPSNKEIRKHELLPECNNIKKELDTRIIEFEKNHCKIKNKGLYLHSYLNSEGSDVIQFLTYKQLTENYRDEQNAFNRYNLDNVFC